MDKVIAPDKVGNLDADVFENALALWGPGGLTQDMISNYEKGMMGGPAIEKSLWSQWKMEELQIPGEKWELVEEMWKIWEARNG